MVLGSSYSSHRPLALVVEMLKGTSRKPEEVWGRFHPRLGTLTGRNWSLCTAPSYGSRPEYMPVLVAALEGFLTPEVNWRLALSGTEPTVDCHLNGPVVKEIGIGCEQGAAGKGHHANGSIGYAINLIAYVVGGSRPPMLTRSTASHIIRLVCWVLGENRHAAGWKPLHVRVRAAL